VEVSPVHVPVISLASHGLRVVTRARCSYLSRGRAAGTLVHALSMGRAVMLIVLILPLSPGIVVPKHSTALALSHIYILISFASKFSKDRIIPATQPSTIVNVHLATFNAPYSTPPSLDKYPF
jgi:hypothetical protein